nr:hypothetical protein [Tanacetum cinerariifolium]
MSTLKFADVHNLVALLSKPTESEGFEQIVDFLNANPIKYTLTVNPTFYTSCIEQFWDTVKAKTVNWEVQLQALLDGKKVIITESTIRRDLQLEDAEGVDCLPNAAIFEQLTLMGKPRRKVIEVPQPSNPTKHVADEAVNEEMDYSLEKATITATSLDAEQDRGNIFKTQSKATPNEPGSQETSSGDGPRCQETIRDTVAQTRVLDLETTKTTQSLEIDSLKRRVKKFESRKRSRTHRLKILYKVGLSARVESFEDEGLGEEDASKQGRIADIDVNEDIYLVNVHNDEDMFGVNDLDGDEANKVVIQEPELGTTTTTPTTITAASSRPKAKGLVIHEQEQAPTPIVSSQQPSQVKDKGKVKMVEPEPVKKLSTKDQLMLAQRLQVEKQEELTDAEKAKLFMQFLEKMRKFFAAKKAKEKRNIPPTRAQQRSIMSMKRANTFVDYMTKLVLESLKKAEAGVAEDDGDDVATPLSSKSSTIVDYKIHKEGKKIYF